MITFGYSKCDNDEGSIESCNSSEEPLGSPYVDKRLMCRYRLDSRFLHQLTAFESLLPPDHSLESCPMRPFTGKISTRPNYMEPGIGYPSKAFTLDMPRLIQLSTMTIMRSQSMNFWGDTFIFNYRDPERWIFRKRDPK